MVTFRNGEQVEVVFRPMPRHQAIARTPRLTDDYETLLGMARKGNIDAAALLANSLRTCRDAYRDEANLQRAAQRLRSERMFQPADPERPALKLGASNDVEQAIDSLLVQPFEYCRDITDEQLAQAAPLLGQAADGGHYFARQLRAMDLSGPDAIHAWQTLWNDGHATVLPTLVVLHQHGTLMPNERLGADEYTPDYLQAAAYTLIQLGLHEAAAAYGDHSLQINSLTQLLTQLETQLTLAQSQEAVETAARLLRENKKCCIVPW